MCYHMIYAADVLMCMFCFRIKDTTLMPVGYSMTLVRDLPLLNYRHPN